MVLLIDVGNTNIVFGISDGNKIINTVRAETRKEADYDYVPVLQDVLYRKEKIEHAAGAILSSVVPEVTERLVNAIQAIYGIQTIIINDIIENSLVIDIDSPHKLGMDLKADAAAALKKYPCPQLIFDLGTATTCSVLDERGHYIGGAIMPGLKISLEALTTSASQLPMIDCTIPVKEYIGKNTQDAMRVGMLFGHALMLEGFSRTIQKQFTKPLHISLTGGLSYIVKQHMTLESTYDPYLTLEGLLYLYQDTKSKT
ncbi:MAG: type III pantothenate kinase [Treponema sp.]